MGGETSTVSEVVVLGHTLTLVGWGSVSRHPMLEVLVFNCMACPLGIKAATNA